MILKYDTTYFIPGMGALSVGYCFYILSVNNNFPATSVQYIYHVQQSTFG